MTREQSSTPLPRLLAALLSVTLGGAALVGLTALPAAADTAPAAGTPATVSADALPTVQVDGVVWSQAVVGNRVYAGGSFATVRPAGAAPGTSTVPRANLLAYDITTGQMVTSFAPNPNAQVQVVAASPDGSRIYVGGDFTSASGATRYRIAAYNTSDGSLVTSFAPSLDARVKAIVATNTTVYVGGVFSTANGSPRSRLAAFSAANGSLLSWAPSADDSVAAMVLAPDSSKIVVGGAFKNVNGQPAYGMGAVDTATGASLSWAANAVIRNAGANAGITSLTTDGTKIYGSGYVYKSDGAGNFEGSFAADPATGSLVWLEDCHGDTYSTYPSKSGVLYLVGHAHFCGNVGGFPQPNPWMFQRALAFTTSPTGTVATNSMSGYANFGGKPSPSLLTWWPDLATGTYTGQTQAAWNVTGNDSYVVLGGEFPKVNGIAQQGLVRFAVRAAAPNTSAPVLSGAKYVPTITSLAPGTARLAWPADWDRDNASLTYQLVKNGNTAAPIYQTTAASSFWNQPSLGFTDTGLTPGQSYKYRLYVTDPLGNTVVGDPVTYTVPATTPPTGAYSKDVLGDGAVDYYRLDEASGTTAYDWGPGLNDAKLVGGVTPGSGGATPDGDGSDVLNGSDGNIVTGLLRNAPSTFAVEAWFKTTTTTGGKILGFGNSATGASTVYDRHVYLDNAGHVIFGVYSGGNKSVVSTGTYNDGQWHHVVAGLGSGGMTLALDGKTVARNAAVTTAQVNSGYWRVGGDVLTGWTGAPTSSYFAGSVDEVAIYPAPLTPTQVVKHYLDSGRTATNGVRPTDAYGSAVFDAGPDGYWRLGETSGATAYDTTANASDGRYLNGTVLGVPGGVAGTTDTAAGFDGVDDTVAAPGWAIPAPTTFSQELWFSTTTTKGGKLLGFGNTASGSSTSYDRQLYMADNGTLHFGVYLGKTVVVDSAKSYNDGQWHHVVVTDGADGIKLYVDGSVVASSTSSGGQASTGYWRLGGDNLNGWPSRPTSSWFGGSLDEVAVYPRVLTSDEVARHYQLGNSSAPNTPPTAAFSASSSSLTATLDASSSVDPDGTVTAYAWSFGDGATGSGGTATHTYAAGGTYAVTLTVTDNRGATASVTQNVTVTKVNTPPTASFTASASALSASFDGRASSDPDGSIAAYAWDFGDGTTGSGGTATHTYATAGTYPVTLTVTDDGGATASATRTVSVSAFFAADAFGRTVTGGFGTADIGGAWTLTGGSSNFSVGGGTGRIVLAAAGNSATAALAGVTSTDTDLRVAVSLDKVQTGGGTYVSVLGRRLSSSSDYRVKLKYAATGSVTAVLESVVNGTEVALKSVTLPDTYAAGDVALVRLQVYGTSPTTLAGKVWKATGSEPAAWTATATDSSASLQSPGGVGVLGYLSGSATNAPMTLTVDDLTAGPHSAG